jgi:hypothetical protein
MHRHPTIVIVNQTTILDDTAVAVAMAALQRQVTYHFEPHWNAGASLWGPWPRDQPIPDEAWALILADDSDQAGALGYHETTHSGQPIGFVFAKTDRNYGLSWTVTASHELLEMLGDPYANQAVQINEQTFVAYEACDAVEADELGYEITTHGAAPVLVSDFMLPAWFIPGAAGPYDYGEHCSKPLELLPGGYIGIWTPRDGWEQHTHGRPRHAHGPRFRLRRAAPKRGPVTFR